MLIITCSSQNRSHDSIVCILSQFVYFCNTGSPNVTVTPASLTLNLGSTAFFSCLDHNSSPGNFTWLLPNSELTLNSSRVTVTSSGGLIVSRLVVEDSGNYTCVVNTAAGQQRVVTMLSVTDIITGSGELLFKSCILLLY